MTNTAPNGREISSVIASPGTPSRVTPDARISPIAGTHSSLSRLKRETLSASKVRSEPSGPRCSTVSILVVLLLLLNGASAFHTFGVSLLPLRAGYVRCSRDHLAVCARLLSAGVRSRSAPAWLTTKAGDAIGIPGTARTCDLVLRRHLLYPSELRGYGACARLPLAVTPLHCSTTCLVGLPPT